MPNRKLINSDGLSALSEIQSVPTLIANQNILLAMRAVYPWIAGASFSGANAAALPAAESGQAWVQDVGAFQISGRAASATSATNTRSYLDSGVTDHWAQVRIDSVPNAVQEWLIVRLQDSSNYYRVGFMPGDSRVILQKIVAGALTEIGSIANQPVTTAGMTLGLRAVGTTLEVYVNNTLSLSVTDSTLTTGTKVGIQAVTTTTQFRSFTVRSS